MKKLYLLTVVAIMLVFKSLAQEVPNSDFETWITEGDYEIPEGFETSNEASSQWENTLTLEKSGDAYSGNWAVKLTAKNLLLDFVSPGFLTTGRFEFDMMAQTSELFGGIYFPYRPEKINGHYKYTPANASDRCIVGAFLLKYEDNEISDTVGYAEFSGTDTVSEYTYFEVDFEYASGETPDSLQLTVLSTDFEDPVPESQMFIDNIAIEMPTGHKINMLEENISIYPNPSNGILNIKSEKGALIQVYDMTGTLLSKTRAGDQITQLDLRSLPKSAYILNIKNGKYEESRVVYIK